MEKAVSRLMKISDDLERWDHQLRMMKLLVTPGARSKYAANLHRGCESLEGVLTKIAGTPISAYRSSLFWNPITDGGSYPPLDGMIAVTFMEHKPVLEEEMEGCSSIADSLITTIREACFALITNSDELAIWDMLTNLVWDE